jgi:hypothetical protein
LNTTQNTLQRTQAEIELRRLTHLRGVKDYAQYIKEQRGEI